ncbi:MAG: sugar ABC transporter permease, partial [Pelagibacteraceae bacterium]
MKKVQFNSKISPYIFLAPQIAILLVFLYWPIVQTFRDAFTTQDAFGFGTVFTGFDNFKFVLSDPSYFISFRFTLIYVFVITLITGSIGLLLAVQANNII